MSRSADSGDERAATEAERYRRVLPVLVHLAGVVLRSLDPVDVAREIAGSARALLGAAVAAVHELDSATMLFRVLAAEADPRDSLRQDVVFSSDAGVLGLAFREGSWVSTADALHDPRVEFSEQLHQMYERTPFRAALAAPLRVRGEIVGFLIVRDLTGRAFDTGEVALASNFADFAAMALEKSRLYAETERRRRTAETLGDLGRLMSRSLDPSAVLHRVVASARTLLSAVTADVFALEAGSGALVSQSSLHGGEQPYGWLRSVGAGEGLSALAIARRAVMSTADIAADRRVTFSLDTRQRLEGAPYRAILAAPLLSKGRVTGVLVAGDRTGRTFSADDLRLAEGLASHAALALENARLYAEAERQRVEAEVFGALAAGISTSLDLDTVLRRVAHAAKTLCGADTAQIALLEPDAKVFAYWSRPGVWESPRVEPGKGLGGIALATGRPARTDDYLEDPRLSQDYAEIVRRKGIVSQLVVPIRVGQRVDGLVYVGNQTRRPFSDADEATLVRLADHAALAIHNAELFAREQASRAEVQAAHDLLRILRELDQAILAADSPQALAASALRHIRRLVPCLRAGVTLFDFDTGLAAVLAVDTDAPTAVGEGSRTRLATFGDLSDLEAGRVRFVSDFEKIGETFRVGRQLIAEGIRACLHVPLLVQGELIGTLNILGAAPAHPTGAQLEAVREVGRSLAVGLAQARLRGELLAGQERLRVLSRRLVEVQEAERRRLARELHDEIGQVLTGLKLTLERATPGIGRARGPAQGRALTESLEKARATVDELLGMVRTLSLDLRPSLLDDMGLAPTLRWHFERYTAQTKVRVDFASARIEGRRFDPEIETAVFRIVQEALTNVARHSGADAAAVRLWADEASLGVQIADDGAGFDPEVAATRIPEGMTGMRERALLLRGRLDVETTPGAGVRVTATLPLEAPAPEAGSA